jgi:hypothetical protein
MPKVGQSAGETRKAFPVWPLLPNWRELSPGNQAVKHGRSFQNMKDLTDPRWIKAKGVLFLLAGLASSALLVVEHPEIRVVLLISISVWCFCRSYYFASYVIEHYVDPSYRFSGLWSFARYLLSRSR